MVGARRSVRGPRARQVPRRSLVVVDLISRDAATTVGSERSPRRDDRGFFVACAAAVTILAQATDPGTALDLLIVSPAVVAFVFQDRLSRFPPEVFALLVVVPIFVVVGVRTVLEPMLFLSVTMVLYVSAHVESTVRAALIAAFAAASPWVIAELVAPEEEIGWQSWVLAHVFTFFIGRLVYRQSQLIVELQQARQALAEQAVAEERRRIARELHDLAGHTLAAMLLHVTGARHVLRRDVDDAERALVDAESVGRASLDQIRATVAALRTDERGTDPALAGSADLDALVDEYRRAGLDITTAISPPVADLPGPVGTALHRITREALANVARHAAGNRVEVRADIEDGDVRLVVADHGRAAPAPDPNSGHFGLVGMSERARALGGTLDARATVDGWRVDARLPILAAPSTEFVPS
jgi:signal transduction histidine kinase